MGVATFEPWMANHPGKSEKVLHWRATLLKHLRAQRRCYLEKP